MPTPMPVQAYVAGSYIYDPGDRKQTHLVSGRVVELTAITATKTYEHRVGDETIAVRVIDFVVDKDESINSVEVRIHNYDAPFLPQGGVTRTTAASPYTFQFAVPYFGAPDFKWGVDDPVPNAGAPSPPFALRVTVKRK